MRRSTRVTLWLAYWAVLCVGTHLPTPSGLKVPTGHLDAVVHALLFAVLSACGAWALSVRTIRSFLLLIFALAGYAALDEWTQSWTGRTPDVVDWLADVIGMVVGMKLYRRRSSPTRLRADRSLSSS